MDKAQMDEILACLDRCKWVLNFYPDGYAVFLIKQWLKQRDRASVREVKASPYAKLLNKPVLKELIATQSVLDEQVLNDIWPAKVEPLVITLGSWGNEASENYYQTSRPGFNLVLQVNLNNQWYRALRNILSISANEVFDCGHPINLDRQATLGWVRLDLDFNTNEVLIEEVQSDFVRWMLKINQQANKAKQKGKESFWFYGFNLKTDLVLASWHQFDSIVMKQWQEALLWSALWFCDHELGMNNIYYHTFDTGALLKGLNYTKPPRSIYTDLPKKFCFELTDIAPQFIAENKRAKRRLKAQKKTAFYRLAG